MPKITVGRCFGVDITDADIPPDVRAERVQSTLANLDTFLINSQLTSEQNEFLKALLATYGDVFAWNLEQLGKAKDALFAIETGDARAFSTAPYKKSPAEKKIIDDEVSKLLKAGIIRESNSPWAVGVSLVKKPHSDTWRPVMDYRKLNSYQNSSFPCPSFLNYFRL